MNTASSALLINRNLPLNELFRTASHAELSSLADIITAKGEGRVSLKESTKQKILEHQKRRSLYVISSDLSREIRAFGSNSLANILRSGRPVEYSEVVEDVAKKLGAKYAKTATTVEIEELIIKHVLMKSLKDKTPAEIEELFASEGHKLDIKALEAALKNGNAGDMMTYLMSAAGPYCLSRLVSAGLTTGLGAIIGAGGAAFGAAVVARAPVLLNPIGAVISAAWMTYDISGPAFRITIPAVIRIAALRQAYIKSRAEQFCMELKKCL